MWINEDLIEICSITYNKDLEHFIFLLENNNWKKNSLQRKGPLLGSSVILHQKYFAKEQYIDQIMYDEEDKTIQDLSYIFLDWILKIFPEYTILKGEISTCPPNTEQGFHIDPRIFHRFSKRLHLPIITNNFSFLEIETIRYHLLPFKLYEFNNLKKHRSINLGSTIRTHIIVDIIKTEWFNKIKDKEDIKLLYKLIEPLDKNNKINPEQLLATWSNKSFIDHVFG